MVANLCHMATTQLVGALLIYLACLHGIRAFKAHDFKVRTVLNAYACVCMLYGSRHEVAAVGTCIGAFKQLALLSQCRLVLRQGSVEGTVALHMVTSLKWYRTA